MNNLSDNPLLQASTLPFQAPHFDRIKDTHFRPAIIEGMRRQLEEVKAIATNSEAPTFANTIEAMERSGRDLDRASAVFYNLTSSHTNDSLQAIKSDLAPKLPPMVMRSRWIPPCSCVSRRYTSNAQASASTRSRSACWTVTIPVSFVPARCWMKQARSA